MIILLIAQILLYLYLRYVSFKPFMMLYAKHKIRKNQNTPQQIKIEETPFPILYPSILAQVQASL